MKRARADATVPQGRSTRLSENSQCGDCAFRLNDLRCRWFGYGVPLEITSGTRTRLYQQPRAPELTLPFETEATSITAKDPE